MTSTRVLAVLALVAGCAAPAGAPRALTPTPIAGLDGPRREARAAYRAGLACYERHDFDGELASYRRAVALDPTLHSAWLALGLALLADDDLAGARETLRRAEELSPGDDRARFWLDVLEDDAKPARSLEGVDVPPRPDHLRG